MNNSPLHVAYPGNARYPDPAVEVLDPAFLRYRIFSASVASKSKPSSSP